MRAWFLGIVDLISRFGRQTNVLNPASLAGRSDSGFAERVVC